MSNGNYWKLLRLVSCALLLGCEGPADELSLFFDNVSGSTNSERLQTFKESELDSAGRNINLIYQDVKNEYNMLVPKSKFDHFAGINFERTPDSIKVVYLSIVFHAYLNGKDFGSDYLKNEIKKRREYEWQKIVIHGEMEKNRIARINNNFIIGDTINIDLPIRDYNGTISTFYYGEVLPDSISYKDGKKLVLRGIMVGKTNGSLASNESYDDLTFILKVIQISDTNVMVNGRKIGVGDTTLLDVKDYARIIE